MVRIDYFAEISMSNVPFRKETIPKWNGGQYDKYSFSFNFSNPNSNRIGLAVPIVTYDKSNYAFIIPDRINIVPIIQNIVSECTVKPELPQGLSLDKKTCEISGVATVTELSKDYTITPRNGAGDGEVSVLKIEIMDCSSSGKVAYSITYFTGSDHSQVKWNFMTAAFSSIVENDVAIQNEDNKEHYFTGCAESTNYKLGMSNPKSGPWPETAYVEITITGMPPLKFRKTGADDITEDIASNY